jgi:hypothetical protein
MNDKERPEVAEFLGLIPPAVPRGLERGPKPDEVIIDDAVPRPAFSAKEFNRVVNLHLGPHGRPKPMFTPEQRERFQRDISAAGTNLAEGLDLFRASIATHAETRARFGLPPTPRLTWRTMMRRRRGGVEFREDFGQLALYLEPRDWWIGYYRGSSHHYVCVLPCLVIRWNRR